MQGHRGEKARALEAPASTWASTARTATHPVPERQRLGAGHRRVHAGRGRRRRLAPAGGHRRRDRKTVRARDLMRQISQATWECADPGMQFDTTINRWHTAATTGRINGNPCIEYMHLDNSACNLASINLFEFLDPDDTFDVDGFKAASRSCSPPRRSSSAGPTTRPAHRRDVPQVPPARPRLRQPRRPAHGARPALRLRRGPRLGGGHHRADDRPRVRDVGPHRGPHGPVRGYADNEEHMLRCSNAP